MDQTENKENKKVTNHNGRVIKEYINDIINRKS